MIENGTDTCKCNGNITENKVSNVVNTMNNISDNESRKLVGVSNGVVISCLLYTSNM